MSGRFPIEVTARPFFDARRPAQRAAVLVVTALLGAACGSSAGDADLGPTATQAVSTESSIAPMATPPPTAPATDPPTTSPITSSETNAMTTDPDPDPTTATSPTPVTDATPDAAAPSDCRRVTDFDDDADLGWVIVNDGVMGGRSNGTVEIVDSVMRFSGSVVTDGGGFTSVRYRLDGGELARSTRMTMRVRADDRVYGVTFEDDAEFEQRSVSHRADLDTTGAVDADGWTTATVEYTALEPSVFGRAVTSPAFDPQAAREVGIIIADGVDGEFSLDVDWIDVCD